jgi:hypothetical protein
VELHIPEPPPYEPGDSPVTGTSEESEAALRELGIDPAKPLLEKLVNPNGAEEPA